MKKILFTLFVSAITCVVFAQNIQLHYDVGRFVYDDEMMAGRPLFTSTVEMFKPDKWGSTFFFVDMDYKSDGVASAYWELARELKFWKGPISAHIEYNGGLNWIKNAYLLGATYTYNSSDFSKGFSLSVMYKNIQKHEILIDNKECKKPHNYQFTGVWYMNFAKNQMCTFMGFADLWREKNSFGDFVFLAEPQFWLNLNKINGFDDAFNLSIGTEVEISNNFAARDGFYVVPTAAIKWSF